MWPESTAVQPRLRQDFVCLPGEKRLKKNKSGEACLVLFTFVVSSFPFCLKKKKNKCFSECLPIVNGHCNSFFSTKYDVLFQVFWKGGSVVLKEIKLLTKLFMFLQILQISHSQESTVLITYCCTKYHDLRISLFLDHRFQPCSLCSSISLFLTINCVQI